MDAGCPGHPASANCFNDPRADPDGEPGESGLPAQRLQERSGYLGGHERACHNKHRGDAARGHGGPHERLRATDQGGEPGPADARQLPLGVRLRVQVPVIQARRRGPAERQSRPGRLQDHLQRLPQAGSRVARRPRRDRYDRPAVLPRVSREPGVRFRRGSGDDAVVAGRRGQQVQQSLRKNDSHHGAFVPVELRRRDMAFWVLARAMDADHPGRLRRECLHDDVREPGRGIRALVGHV